MDPALYVIPFTNPEQLVLAAAASLCSILLAALSAWLRRQVDDVDDDGQDEVRPTGGGHR